jgi:hypothetical protein
MAAPVANDAAERVIVSRIIAGDTNDEIRRRLRKANMPGSEMRDQSFTHYRQRPDVKAILADAHQAAKSAGLAVRLERVRRLQRLASGLEQIIEERAEDPDMDGIPGGETGLVIKKIKGIGGADNFREVEEYEPDVATIKELRELHKQIAMELGEWNVHVDMTSAGKPLFGKTDEEIRAIAETAVAEIAKTGLASAPE